MRSRGPGGAGPPTKSLWAPRSCSLSSPRPHDRPSPGNWGRSSLCVVRATALVRFSGHVGPRQRATEGTQPAAVPLQIQQLLPGHAPVHALPLHVANRLCDRPLQAVPELRALQVSYFGSFCSSQLQGKGPRTEINSPPDRQNASAAEKALEPTAGESKTRAPASRAGGCQRGVPLGSSCKVGELR